MNSRMIIMIAMVAVVMMMMGHASAVGPTVSDEYIYISGANGTGGVYIIGDTVTATWNNTATGDNNTDVDEVTVNFTEFGGGAAVTATNYTNTWTVTYSIVAGSINGTNKNVAVNATNSSGSTITSDTTNATVDDIAPTMSSAARVDNTHITVTMSESVTNLTTSSDGGFIVAKNGDPETTYAVSDIAAGSSANLVVLTVADISGSIATGVKVTYNASVDNGTINDTAGNALATNATGVIVAAWQTSSGGSSGGDGTYPPGWFETPTPTVTATKAPTPSATATATDAPPGDKVTPAPTKKTEAAKATTPEAEGTTAEDAKNGAPGFTAVFVIAGMLAVAYAMMRRRG